MSTEGPNSPGSSETSSSPDSSESRSEHQTLLVKSDQEKLDEEEEDTGKGLARTLTLTNCVTIVVGSIVGSGIFVSPTGVQEAAGSVGSSLVMWILCGVWCALGAYCYAELGTLITKSGGEYAYIMEAFGPFMAFLRLWIESMVIRPCFLTIVMLTFALYLLRPFFPDCDPPNGIKELLAIIALSILCVLNCWSVKATVIVQDWFTYAKVVALVLVIITGGFMFIAGGPQYRDSFDNIFEGNFHSFGTVAVGFYSGLFAYHGWAHINFITEELINPTRNLPLSVMISMILVIIVYVLFNMALYVVLSPEEMLISPAVAVVFAEKMYGKFAFIMPLCVAISSIGSANALIMTSSRLYYCGAREGQMPILLTMINKTYRTPIPAVIFNCVVSIGYLLLSNNIYVLIAASQVTAWIAIIVVTLALFRLRCTMPDAPRPVKVNIIFPIIFTIGSTILVILSIMGAPKDTAIGLAILFSAVPVYVVFIWYGKIPQWFRNTINGFTIICQKIFMLVDDSKYE